MNVDIISKSQKPEILKLLQEGSFEDVIQITNSKDKGLFSFLKKQALLTVLHTGS